MALLTRAEWRSIGPVLVAVAIAGVGLGVSLPLLAVLLERHGTSGVLIGANTAMTPLAALFITPFLPELLRRFGAARVLVAALLTIGVTLFAMRAYIDVWTWFPLRFLFGVGLAVEFAASEFWINAAAPEHARGRIVGIYATIFSAGWAVGPLILRILDPMSWGPFIVMGVLLALAMVPLSMARATAPQPETRQSAPFLAITLAAPAATLAAFVYGGVEIGVFALLPVYAERLGFHESVWAYMLAAVAAGNVALQYPIGWLADRLDRRHVLIGCALAGLIGALTMKFVLSTPWLLYPSLFLWGGVVVGLYTMGLVLLGERFKGGDLAAANAVFVMLYSAGGLLTPPVSGYAMDVWSPHALMTVLGVLCAAYLVIAVWGLSRRTPSASGP